MDPNNFEELTETTHTATRRWVCGFCNVPIKKGQQYIKIQRKSSQGFSTCRKCTGCMTNR